MQIISGKYKGKKLKPAGRPTLGRWRQVMFDILNNHLVWPDIFFLDPFAGSGALGIEAISRGAKAGVFIENNAENFKILKQNAANLANVTLVSGDCLKIKNSNLIIDLLFLDPPYSFEYSDVICRLQENNWIQDHTLLAIEINDTIPSNIRILKARDKIVLGFAQS